MQYLPFVSLELHSHYRRAEHGAGCSIHGQGQAREGQGCAKPDLVCSTAPAAFPWPWLWK